VARAALARALRDRRVVLCAALALSTIVIVPAVARHRSRTQEIRWLRARLAEKRSMIQRQRKEMAQVAAAVDDLTRTAAIVHQHESNVRRLAHMEQAQAPDAEATLVSASTDGGQPLVSEEAARTLTELGWIEGELASADNSLGVLTAILSERRSRGAVAVPTLWPVRGVVTSNFGARRDPYGGGHEMHPGIDIEAHYGLPVTAGGDGEVIFTGRDPGYGNCVVIDHGHGIHTLYGHLSASYVHQGNRVRRGEPIGALGASGRATGAHLHYEVRVAGEPVDPRRYLIY
jgi:murein DD-endopeptidase MepM/ murein hydrolase activator NlpD